MRITLTRDVLLSGSDMGFSGESHTVSKDLGQHLLAQGFAAEAAEADKPTDPNKRQTKPDTTTKKTK